VKILLDENLPHKLRRALGERDVTTVDYMGWNGLKNGQLLRQAEESGIDVLVTGDRTLQYEQSITGRRIAVVVLSAQKWPTIRDHMPLIEKAIDTCIPGSFTSVDCGLFRRARRKTSETRI
jgi:hypothetical protein